MNLNGCQCHERVPHGEDRAEVAVWWAAANRALDHVIASGRAGHFDDELLAHAVVLLGEVPRRLDAAGVTRRRRLRVVK